MESLAGKVAVITGGASGIGLAMAKLFATEGASIVLADIATDALEVVTNELAATGAELGMRHLHEHLARSRLRMQEHLLDRQNRPGRNAGLVEEIDPILSRLCLQRRIDLGGQFVAPR